MRVQTSELIDDQLDWAVAKCEGRDVYVDDDGDVCFRDGDFGYYSTNWAQGGPIIEREGISTVKQDPPADNWWAFCKQQKPGDGFGPTLLIAAMRCYVFSKLGNEVEIPEELV